MGKQSNVDKTDLGRREVLKGAAAASLATVLGTPELARAAASGLEDVSVQIGPDGKTVSGALALPRGSEGRPGIVLIHEWWGLNDQVKAVAAEFAREGYVALAVDLYDGQVATTPDDARKYMGTVDAGVAKETLVTWINWLRGHKACSGTIGTVGWCFGGGWSLNAGLAAPVDAVVIYYGNVTRTVDQLSALKAPVLGHFATRDGWIDRDMVAGFEANMDTAGRSYSDHWYEADHAFANPTSARYDEADAQMAWQRTLEFFKANL